MSEELLIRCCAPTLASMKTGSMFSCPFASREEMTKELCQVNRRLRHKGVRALPLRFRENTGLVYVYRPGQLHRDIREKTACNLLRDRGYPCENAALCIRRLMDRIDRQQDFPHEVGLFLGYPPGDVDGFIHRRDEYTLSGKWKVYGDAEKAKHTFAKYKKCTDVYLKKLSDGRSLEKLTVSS
ncbi:MAG: DUF3793 family protein [Clostridiales bacterium]|nr:DUF3793 family protein [Clostridiales bacterium]